MRLRSMPLRPAAEAAAAAASTPVEQSDEPWQRTPVPTTAATSDGVTAVDITGSSTAAGTTAATISEPAPLQLTLELVPLQWIPEPAPLQLTQDAPLQLLPEPGPLQWTQEPGLLQLRPGARRRHRAPQEPVSLRWPQGPVPLQWTQEPVPLQLPEPAQAQLTQEPVSLRSDTGAGAAA